MCGYFCTAVVTALVVVLLLSYWPSCFYCYRGLCNKQSMFDNEDVIDKLYKNKFLTPSDMGLDDCTMVCVNETRCIRYCPSRRKDCTSTCSVEEKCRLDCYYPTILNATVLFPTDTNDTTTSEGNVTLLNRRKRALLPGMGLDVCTMVCVNETRCIRHCPSRRKDCNSTCGVDEYCRWDCDDPTVSTYVNASELFPTDTNDTTTSEGNVTLLNRRKRSPHACASGNIVETGSCPTCLRWIAPSSLFMSGTGAEKLHVIQFYWAASTTNQKRYQFVQEGVCAETAHSRCLQIPRKVDVIVSKPSPVIRVADLHHISHGFARATVSSHCSDPIAN